MTEPDPLTLPLDEFARIPGLLRRWEIEGLLTPTTELLVLPAGAGAGPKDLYVAYRRTTFNAGQPARITEPMAHTLETIQ